MRYSQPIRQQLFHFISLPPIVKMPKKYYYYLRKKSKKKCSPCFILPFPFPYPHSIKLHKVYFSCWPIRKIHHMVIRKTLNKNEKKRIRINVHNDNVKCNVFLFFFLPRFDSLYVLFIIRITKIILSVIVGKKTTNQINHLWRFMHV